MPQLHGGQTNVNEVLYQLCNQGRRNGTDRQYKSFMVVAACLVVLGRPNLLPVTEPEEDSNATPASRATPAAPHWVIYSDKWVSDENGPPASGQPSTLLLALAFTHLTLPQASASSSRPLVPHAPISTGADPTATANNLVAFVKQYGPSGADIDYEVIRPVNAIISTFFVYLAKCNGAVHTGPQCHECPGRFRRELARGIYPSLRARLPEGQYIITHVPVAPWFSPIYASGAYLAVDQTVGSLIDWYNVQLVIGKPATTGVANNGYMDSSILAGCLGTTKAQGWDGSIKVWEYPDAAASWMATVRSVAFPE
ncbi:glycoside hydrolase family 18 protein [Pisolithus croceorrhizus]|nr:glycoside hydrolase family 18 protein [Pisolithus croceorrhizus]